MRMPREGNSSKCGRCGSFRSLASARAIGVTDPPRLQAPPKIVIGTVMDSKLDIENLRTVDQFGASQEKKRILHPNVEACDSTEAFYP